MNIKAFTRDRSNEQLTKNFKAGEFFCKCGACDKQLIDLDHIEKLQILRDLLNSPIHINCGYRCPPHNLEVGGVRDSQHIFGMATDVSGKSLEDIKTEAECLGFGGIGVYPTFIHLDSRSGKARW